MTTASKVTMVRILMIPLFIAVILTGSRYSDIIGLVIFAVASVTDSVDGYIARKYNQVSDFGKLIDPLADKLLVTAAILIFIERGQMSSWAAMIIITREFAVTALRLVAVEGGIVIAAGTSGKIKTIVSILSICVMLTPLHSLYIIPGLATVDSACVALMLITTIWSGAEYFYKNKGIFTTKK